MKRLAMMVVFVVSWPAGIQQQVVPCKGQEPKEIVCVQPVQQWGMKEYKNKVEAKAVYSFLTEILKIEGSKLEEKK